MQLLSSLKSAAQKYKMTSLTLMQCAMCNTKGFKSKITGNTESKVMVRCTACNSAMLVEHCYVDMSTPFQLEKKEKQFNVVANHATPSIYINKDIFQYRKSIDELTKKTRFIQIGSLT